MEWPDNVVLDLIKDVQHSPLLWDSKDPCFKLLRKKNDTWLALAAKYKTTAEEVRKKWMSVRASYRREKARVAERSQTDSEFSPSWFAYSAMLFYDGRYKPRRGNTKRLMRELDPMEHLNTDDDIKDFHGDDDSDEDFDDTDQQTPPPPPDNVPRTTFTTLPQSQRLLKVRKLPRTDDSSFGGESNSRHNKWTPDESSRDESVIFGEYVGQKIRKLDSRSRAVAIHHINGILFNAEMGQYKNSFLDVSGGLQIQPQRSVSMSASDGYFFGRPEQQTHLVMNSPSSATKEIHSKVVQPTVVNFLNGTTSEVQDEVELKVLEQNDIYNS